MLTHKGFDPRIGVHTYRARLPDCRGCPVHEACADGPLRTVSRMVDEDARDLARAETGTPLLKRSMRLRRGIERLFADAVRRGLGRLRLRGLRGAAEEFPLAAAVLNLLLLARPAGKTRRRRDVPSLPAGLGRMARVSLACIDPASPVAALPAPVSLNS